MKKDKEENLMCDAAPPPKNKKQKVNIKIHTPVTVNNDITGMLGAASGPGHHQANTAGHEQNESQTPNNTTGREKERARERENECQCGAVMEVSGRKTIVWHLSQ